jgi:hypothetical protein
MSKREGVFIDFVLSPNISTDAGALMCEDMESHYVLRGTRAAMTYESLKLRLGILVKTHPFQLQTACATFDWGFVPEQGCPQDDLARTVAIALKALDAAIARKPIEYVRIDIRKMDIRSVWDLVCTLPARVVSLEIETVERIEGSMPMRVFRRMKGLREL